MPMALHPEEWTSRFLRRLAELLPDAPAVSAVWALKAYATLPGRLLKPLPKRTCGTCARRTGHERPAATQATAPIGSRASVAAVSRILDRSSPVGHLIPWNWHGGASARCQHVNPIAHAMPARTASVLRCNGVRFGFGAFWVMGCASSLCCLTQARVQFSEMGGDHSRNSISVVSDVLG